MLLAARRDEDFDTCGLSLHLRPAIAVLTGDPSLRRGPRLQATAASSAPRPFIYAFVSRPAVAMVAGIHAAARSPLLRAGRHGHQLLHRGPASTPSCRTTDPCPALPQLLHQERGRGGEGWLRASASPRAVGGAPKRREPEARRRTAPWPGEWKVGRLGRGWEWDGRQGRVEMQRTVG